MPKLIKKRSKKAGFHPEPSFTSERKRLKRQRLPLWIMMRPIFKKREIKTIEECFVFKDKPTVTWINIDGLHQVEILEKLGECYGLHPLVLEDILNTDQRPKMEDYGDYIYIVLKMLDHNHQKQRDRYRSRSV